MLIKRPVNEKIEDKLNEYRDNLQEMQMEIGEIRKTGADTAILDLKLFEVEPLIKMARATYEQPDIDKIDAKFEEIRGEMKIAEEGDSFVQIRRMIEECFQLLRDGKKSDAQAKWDKIQALYKKLPKDLQKTVFSACLELRRRFS